MAKKLSRPTQGERERLNKRRRLGASFGIKATRCKMKTYGGVFIMAGPAPRGMKPEQCENAALANGFCEKHNPEHW